MHWPAVLTPIQTSRMRGRNSTEARGVTLGLCTEEGGYAESATGHGRRTT